jgi:hypothetical protein
MQKARNHFDWDREKALADGLRDVASELRLIEATDLVAFIRTEQFGNIANLVSSSTELYFKPGTVRFGQSGEVSLKWGGAPSVALDMEFQHGRVKVYFRLLLEALQAGVEIHYINFENASPDPEHNTQLLIEAIASARLSPIPPAWTDAAMSLQGSAG